MDFPSGWISPEGNFRRTKGDFDDSVSVAFTIEWKVV
jgi:hypothetical protein